MEKQKMEMVNAEVDCDVARLNVPLRTWRARQGCAFVARLRRVPSDVGGVFVRVTNTVASTDCLAHLHADGSWIVQAPPSAFPSAGEFSYTVHAQTADGEPCAIGEGRVKVEVFE